ncbi:MAG TPA: hypothetical protein VM889_06235 [Candidatus Thermoplasmatota archaeon]|nr:hypothetical protein [Candidatus Thermoplasmatota archaeon]
MSRSARSAHCRLFDRLQAFVRPVHVDAERAPTMEMGSRFAAGVDRPPALVVPLTSAPR